jgi:hypothetical protein
MHIKLLTLNGRWNISKCHLLIKELNPRFYAIVAIDRGADGFSDAALDEMGVPVLSSGAY